eukprot:gene21863-28894_t
MAKLSPIVFVLSLLNATGCYYSARSPKSPLFLTVGLCQSAVVGFLASLAASDALSPHSTWLFGKRRSGSFSWLGHVLFWPYFLGLRIKLFLGHGLSSEPLWHKITTGWYLGGWPRSSSVLPPGKPSVLDVTCELPRTHPNKYLCLPVWDTQGTGDLVDPGRGNIQYCAALTSMGFIEGAEFTPTVSQINEGVEWCLNERKQGRNVYIHCAHGHGRSATVMCACFLELGLASDPSDSIAVLKGARPKVRMSWRQQLALDCWYQKHLEAKAGAKLNSSSVGSDKRPGL